MKKALRPPRGFVAWLEAECELVFVPFRREFHIARPGREQTLCMRSTVRRPHERGDSGRLCRVCRQAAHVAFTFDTRPIRTRYDIRHNT